MWVHVKNAIFITVSLFFSRSVVAFFFLFYILRRKIISVGLLSNDVLSYIRNLFIRSRLSDRERDLSIRTVYDLY